ncbi:MAG: NAD(P)H-quinone oxidoreductase subunit L [Cyanobacteria bacterium P01_H01_bin.162]
MLDNLPVSTDTLLVLGVYGALAVAYLLVIPAAILLYLKTKWNTMGSVERFLVYGLVFAFFPGMLLLSPILNFRPQPRSLNS